MIAAMLKQAHSSFGGSAEARLAAQAADIPSFRRSVPMVRAELRRCRRYEHPLAVLVLGVDPESVRRATRRLGDESADGWFPRRFELMSLLVLGWILRDTTRECDIVTYAADYHAYVVVMPETDADGARSAAERMADTFRRRSSLDLRMGGAAFPADGLTLEDLFERARTERLASEPAAEIGSESRRASHG